MGMKKRDFGAGRWNGFGGKLKPGETVEEAARREVSEEAGIVVHDLTKLGVMDFSFKGKPGILEVNFFKSTDYSGEPMESEEMRPQWFDLDKIPFDKMWPSDVLWFPFFLTEKKFTGTCIFGPGDSILEHKVKEVEVI